MKIVLRDVEQFYVLLFRKGFSKRAFARAANIGESTLIQICSGARHPSPTTAARIADALQVEFEAIFELSRGVGGQHK